jgi:hypothetical protein
MVSDHRTRPSPLHKRVIKKKNAAASTFSEEQPHAKAILAADEGNDGAIAPPATAFGLV